jgi:hypothetical protein
MLTVDFGIPSYVHHKHLHIFDILTNGTNPLEVLSSLLHVDFGVYCLRKKLTLKRRLSG